MDVEKTIEFLLAHQARMAAENEIFHAHQAEVRAEHEKRFERLEVSQLELSERLDGIARLLSDSIEHHERVVAADRATAEGIRESQEHTDERLNALIQVVDEVMRRPQQ